MRDETAAVVPAADAFAAGKATPQWLKQAAPRLHIPGDIAALQRDWERWLAVTMAADPA